MKHKDFYDKNVWIDRFLNLQKRHFLLQGLDYPLASSFGSLQHIIEFSLNSGKIVLTEQDVAAMESIPKERWNLPHNSLTDVFIILCGTGKILPTWNNDILHHAIYNYFKIYSNQSLIDYVPSMELRLGRLLANPTTSPEVVFRMISIYFNKRLRQQADPILRQRIYTRHQEFMMEALALPQMLSHILLSDERILSYFFKQPKVEERINRFKELTKKFGILVKPLKDSEKAKHKLRMRQYKEGIAMAVWHPKNMERWLETGGWPLIASIAGDDGLA